MKSALSILFLLLHFPFFGFAGIDWRKADDQALRRKALDIWHRDNTIEGHIQELSHNMAIYFQFAFQLSNDVLMFDQKGQFLSPQRSLVADALAVFVSRNFTDKQSAAPEDLQLKMTEFEARTAEKHPSKAKLDLHPRFYGTALRALSYSSLLTESFYRRVIMWALRAEPGEQAHFFLNWHARNQSPELTKFLLQFKENNQSFLRDLQMNPEFSRHSLSFWDHFFTLAKVQTQFSNSSCKRAVQPSF